MNLRTVAARGLIGLSKFPAGVSIDFSTMPEGLVALVGPNGAGKTTVLELPIIGLWNRFPSRWDNTLSDSCDAKDAFVEVVVDVAGRGTYRARVQVDSSKPATAGVLELTDVDGVTRPLNDGKISTFRDAIARELPALELVLASVFAAQNRQGAFSEQSKKDRKDLFATLMGFDQYERFAATASAASALVDRRVLALRGQLDALLATTSADHEDAISRQGNDLQADLLQAEHAQMAAAAALTTADATVADRRASAEAYATAASDLGAATVRREDRQRELDRARDDQAALERDETRDLEHIRTTGARALATQDGLLAAIETVQTIDRRHHEAVSRIAATLTADLAATDLTIANNRTLLLDREPEIRAAVQALAALTARLPVDRQAVATAKATVTACEDALQRLQVGIRLLGDPQGELARATTDAALIETLPFGERCVDAGCAFVSRAAEAKARIPTLTAAVSALDGRHADERDSLAALTRSRDALRTVEASLADREVEIATRRIDADLLPRLDAAKDRIAELEQQKRRLTDDAETARAVARADRDSAVLTSGQQRAATIAARETILEHAAVDLRAATAARAEKRAALAARARVIADAIAELDQAIAALTTTARIHAPAQAALVDAEAARTAARQAAGDVERRLAVILEQVRAFEARRTRFKAAVAARDQLAAAVRTLEDHRQEWTLLAKILGRDGLQILEIANAGPAVSDLANDLLNACYGGRFQLELVTQELKADGKGFKEVFEIKVTDAEAGQDKDLADLSGGERVIVDESLRSAIALLVNQRNTQPIRTAWRDETAGALDPDARARYVAMLRRIQQRGGFTRLFFISHDADVAALADAQLHIHDGRIDVRYPPFADPVATEAA